MFRTWWWRGLGGCWGSMVSKSRCLLIDMSRYWICDDMISQQYDNIEEMIGSVIFIGIDDQKRLYLVTFHHFDQEMI